MWSAPNRLLAARVAGQFGLITREQALGGGLTHKEIACHLASGRWVRVHPGVYLTVPGRDGWDVRSMAAVLWAGRGGALFGRSAGYAWGLVRSEPGVVEVVVPSTRVVGDRPGVRVTRSRRVTSRVDATAWPHRISAAHTVLDLATGSGADTAVSLAARALSLRVATAEDIASALMTRPTQEGRGVLLEALSDVGNGSESAAEVRYVRDVERRHALPAGRRQVPVGDGRRRDIEYDEFGLVVEIDGRLGHAGWAAQQRDGIRDRGVVVSGRLAIRCYWPDLVPTACALASDVAVILTMRGWRGQPRACGPECSLKWEGSVPLEGA